MNAPNPDWVAWLARAEAEQTGEDDDSLPPAPHVMAPGRVPGWRRLGDLIPEITASAIAGGLAIGVAGECLHLWRLFQ